MHGLRRLELEGDDLGPSLRASQHGRSSTSAVLAVTSMAVAFIRSFYAPWW
jgi:hypothetical protein